jgi:selT/selW/selH-like putative selenoprotein
MAVTKERFEQGLTYSAFKEQMTRNRDRLEHNEQTVEFSPDDLAYFSNLPEALNVLVLAEDWCGDVIANLPVLARLAEKTGTLNLRIFLRDQNLDLMDQYLYKGEFRSIPVFVFFDQAFRELGYWIERPAVMYEMQAQMRRELFASDPRLAGYTPDTPFGDLPEDIRAIVRDATSAFREQHRAFSDSEVVREIRALLQHGIAQSARSEPQQGAPAASPISIHTGKHVKVSITYCSECGYEPQTLELTSALMRAFPEGLSSIEIIPWQDGAFDVTVNGDLVHSMFRDGGFPENETILAAVRERIAR